VRIATVVQGRFHAFDLVREFTKRGNSVELFTNYPEWAVNKYGAGASMVRSYWQHGVARRIAGRLGFRAEAAWDRQFGIWAAKQIGRGQWDVLHTWSGVSLELLREHGNRRGATLLLRGSAHIRTQAQILREEQERTGVRVEQPSSWIMEREEEEYQLTDRILVLSNFARRSFVERGISPEKLCLLPLGANSTVFRPQPETIEERLSRILSGAPLRVLYVGNLSLQKGMHDAVNVVRALDPRRFEFRFVGSVSKDAGDEVRMLRRLAQVVPKQPQSQLREQYSWADVFVFPTIQDGFAAVLSQAQASALPILCTTNCGGPDIVREGETGWVLPIRSPEAFTDRLTWCDEHRDELAAMVEGVYRRQGVREWKDVARDFEDICRAGLLRAMARSGEAQ